MTANSVLFLKLLRVAFCSDEALRTLSSDNAFWQNVDWDALLSQISENGMEAIAFDGLQRLNGCDGFHSGLELEGNEDIRYEWMGLNITTEQDFEHYGKVLAALAGYLASNGAGRILVLKGYGLALNYPYPSHRTVGDIDIYSLDGKSAEIDKLLSRFAGFNKCSRHARHSHATFHEISIENHYCFSDAVNNPRKDKALEQVLVEEALNHSRKMVIDGVEFYVPSANFNAIFLMWHMAQHFRLENVSLRQLTDWMNFLKKESSNVDWHLVTEVWSKNYKTEFASMVNGALIDYFGMDPVLVPSLPRNHGNETKFIDFVMEAPPLKIRGIEAVLKYWRRRWNFRITQNESWFRLLMRAVKRHLISKS